MKYLFRKKQFPLNTAALQALIEMCLIIWEPRNTTKNTVPQTSHKGFIGKENLRRYLTLLKWEAAGNLAGSRVNRTFLAGQGLARWRFQEWGLVIFQIENLGILLCKVECWVGPLGQIECSVSGDWGWMSSVDGLDSDVPRRAYISCFVYFDEW